MTKSEHSEQVVLVSRVRHFYPQAVIFAIPNGGFRDKREAARLKAEGVLSGVPDLFLAVRTADYGGLFIEMKRADRGALSASQKERITQLRTSGYHVVVCRGAEEAWAEVTQYLQSK